MLRFLLAAFAFATFLSRAASFSPVSSSNINYGASMRHPKYFIGNVSYRNSNNIRSPIKLSLSPNDIPGPLLYTIVFAACFRIGASIAVIGQPRLPNDDNDGSSLSRCRRRLVGSKVVRLPELGSRVRVFYPISEKAAKSISTNSRTNSNSNSNIDKYCTDGRATSDGMAGLVGFKQLGLSFLLAHLAEAPSGCYTEDAIPTASTTTTKAKGETETNYSNDNHNDIDALASCELSAPLLVYSHGYGGNMDMATYFLRAMAQKGIVVAALEHTDGTASSTVLPDGSVLNFDSSLCSLKDGLDKRASEILEAARYIPSLLPRSSNDDCVFLGGHSYGAPSVLLATQNHQRQLKDINSPSPIKIAGLILHDPALSMGRNSVQLPPTIPTVSYVSDEYNRANIQCGDRTYHVQGAFHGNFVDAPLWAPLWVMRTLSVVIPACGPADPETVHSELAESARAFCFGLLQQQDANEEESDDPLASIITSVGSQSLFERVG